MQRSAVATVGPAVVPDPASTVSAARRRSGPRGWIEGQISAAVDTAVHAGSGCIRPSSSTGRQPGPGEPRWNARSPPGCTGTTPTAALTDRPLPIDHSPPASTKRATVRPSPPRRRWPTRGLHRIQDGSPHLLAPTNVRTATPTAATQCRATSAAKPIVNASRVHTLFAPWASEASVLGTVPHFLMIWRCAVPALVN